MTDVESFFSEDDKKQILDAIREAEHRTSGEIRVHLENSCKIDVLDRAAYIFEKLKMHQTKLRNGVLFYLAVKDRKFAILGDAGINRVVADDFWDQIKENMLNEFKEERFAQGLTTGISMTGKALRKFFPYQSDDVNELPDDISFGSK